MSRVSPSPSTRMRYRLDVVIESPDASSLSREVPSSVGSSSPPFEVMTQHIQDEGGKGPAFGPLTVTMYVGTPSLQCLALRNMPLRHVPPDRVVHAEATTLQG